MNATRALRPPRTRLSAKLAAGDQPWVTLKAATSLDGRIATRSGESQWITGTAAREHAHRLRAGHDGIVVGIGTVLADDPQLTARLPGARPPVRIVLDSRARVAPHARCLAADGTRRIVVVGSQAPPERLRALEAMGIEVLTCATPRPEPVEFLPRLRQAGLATLLVEGGARIHANLIAQDAADELFLYVAGCVFGDLEAPGWCAPLGIDRLADAPRLTLSAPRMVGQDVLLHGFFRPREPHLIR